MKAIRAIERQLEIIGEAVTQVNRLNPEIQITGVKSIIALRNLLLMPTIPSIFRFYGALFKKIFLF